MGNALAKDFEKLKKKEVVDLRKRALTELPTTIGLLRCKELILAENDVVTIPDEIGKLPNLEILDFSNNRINSIPPEIGDLKLLRELIIHNNKLFFSPLTPDLGRLSALNKLDLSHNQIEELPVEIGNLENLETFILSHNAIKFLPPELGENNTFSSDV
jgi:Leucine-rich repeat (LRR) protein